MEQRASKCKQEAVFSQMFPSIYEKNNTIDETSNLTPKFSQGNNHYESNLEI